MGKDPKLIYMEPDTISRIEIFLARIGRVKKYSFSKYVELSAKILQTIIEKGYIPDDLGYILDKQTIEELRDLLDASKKTVEVVA